MDARLRRDDLDFMADAFDPDRVAALATTHLRRPDRPPAEAAGCELVFARRGAGRRLFQYRLRLRLAAGAERTELVTALAYADDNTKRLWSMLRRRPAPVVADDAALAPVAYVPDLDLLLQTFPFDHRLPALTPLLAGQEPALTAALLARFGPGDWIPVAWEAASVRYRVDLRATVRIILRAHAVGSDATAERAFFAKVYAAPDLAEEAWTAQRRLTEALATRTGALAVAPLAAYLPESRLLAHDAVGGAALDDVMSDAGRAADAVRVAAEALATLHQLDLAAPERPETDPISPDRLAMSVARLQATRPDLAAIVGDLAPVIGDALARLGPPPAAPIHGDLKPAHVRIDGGQATLLDFDKLAAGDPARDVADMLIRFGRGLPGKRRDHHAQLIRPFLETYLDRAPGGWADRLPPHYAAALLHEAAAAGESVRASGDDRPGRRARQAEYPRRLLTTAQAALAGDLYAWER